MAGSTLVFEREIDLPREIVWDALVDDVLLSGWLAEASVEPTPGGRYDLVWMNPDRLPPSRGTITVIDPPGRLEVETSNAGTLVFQLGDLPGGTRGRSTALRLTVSIDTEPAFAPTTRAYWLTDLDQLEALLRGHPVDWTHWERDHQEAWTAYLRQTDSGSA